MYVTEDDYVVIGADALAILQKSETSRREVAERSAAEEITGYLGARYDMAAEFAKNDIHRNTKVVMVFCDLALYDLVCSLPQRMGYEIRKQRRDDAVKWLEAAKRQTLNLPTYTSGDGKETDTGNPIKWGSMDKMTNDW